MRFQATLESGGKTATGIHVPDDVVEALGSRRAPVSVTINGYTYRSTVGSMGGRAMLPVSAENRAAAGVVAGDVLDVEVVRDDAPRETPLPEDLAAALGPTGVAAFEALAPSRRKEHVRQVESAKAPETRARRIAKVVEELRPR